MTTNTVPDDHVATHDRLLEKHYPGSKQTFGETAMLYDKGLGTLLPLPANAKAYPPKGTTGWNGREPTSKRLKAMGHRQREDHEVALRLSDNLIALDVDNYISHDGTATKTGRRSLKDIESALGVSLPPTFTSTGRRYEDGAGQLFYRTHRSITRENRPHDQPSIEVLHWGHRYAVVWPSVVVDGDAERVYRWYDQNGNEMEQPPTLMQIPFLPPEWEDYLFADRFNPARARDYDDTDPDTDQVTDEHRKAAEGILEWSLQPENVERGVSEAGGRNNWLNRTAYRLFQFLYAGALPDETPATIGEKLQDALAAIGDQLEAGEAEATLQSAAQAAEVSPTVPMETLPWPDAEDITERLAARAEAIREATQEEAESSWSDVDILAVFDGLENGNLEIPKPTIGQLEGEERYLFYPAATNMVFGDSNSGKTWTALRTAFQVLRDGGEVFYVDYEGNKVSTINRLRDLKVERRWLDRFHYKQPDRAFDQHARELLRAELEQLEPELVVIDSLGESLALDGKNPNADDEVALWFRGLANEAARRGSCVLILDHLPKNSDGRFSIGSQRKRSALSGAQYRQEMVKPFSREEIGWAKLVVTKDREGTTPAGGIVAELVVNTAIGEGIELRAPDPEHTASASDLMPDRILDYVKENPSCTKQALERGVTGNNSKIRSTLDALVKEGKLRIDKSGASQKAPQRVNLAE